MRANQLRLCLSVMAYSLLCGLRRLGLRATQFAHAQVGTIRLRLLKIRAQIRVTVRKIWVQMASNFPLQESLPTGSSTTALLSLSRPQLAIRSLTTPRRLPYCEGFLCL
jgi:hypothetical protein